ncbi:MAG TPA: hypothetical protein VFX50_01900 [Gemmatimonadales bacterium]|nr:hypothetical protein [Gemmatimonadales bacterium]
MRIASLALVIALALPARAVAQAPQTPEAALNAFMKAVADSNLGRMSQLWGSEKGSASKTKAPDGYQQRIYIMYAYLRGASHKVTMVQPDTSNGKARTMVVDFSRGDCQKQVLVRTVKTKNEGWLVNWIDIASIGTPGRSCTEQPPEQQAAPPAPPS